MSAVSDMPVGCLAHRARHTGCRRADSREKDTRDSRTRRRKGENITLMQHTLLLQIFRTEGSAALSCPTCISFSPSCCQTESGWSILAKVVEANCQCVWNMPLVKAVACLKFQVYDQGKNSQFYILIYPLGLCVSRDAGTLNKRGWSAGPARVLV